MRVHAGLLKQFSCHIGKKNGRKNVFRRRKKIVKPKLSPRLEFNLCRVIRSQFITVIVGPCSRQSVDVSIAL